MALCRRRAGILFRFALALLVSIGPTVLFAQPVDPPITGGEGLGVDRLRSLIRGLPPDSVSTVLQRAYASGGWLNAAVQVDSARGVIITPGPRFTISSIAVRPDSAAALMVRSGFDTTVSSGGGVRYFSAKEIEAEVARLLALADDAGYPLASVIVDPAIDDSAARVDLVLLVTLHDRVTIGEIDVVGSESARDLIALASGVRIGDRFTDETAQDVQSRLRRLNLFASVDEPRLYRADSGRYGLLMTVIEGNANTFDGVIGYQPAGRPEERGSFTGLVNIILRNFFGAGRKLAARLNIPNRGTQEIDLRYGEPFILRLPLDLELGYRQRQEEETAVLTSYVQRYLTADVSYAFADAWSVRLGGALELTIPVNDSSGDCSRQLLNSRTLGSTVGIIYDGRSNPLNPARGIRYATSYSYGSKEIRGPVLCIDSTVSGTDSRQRIELDFESYIPLPGAFVLANGLHFGEIDGDGLEESDLFYFGGQSTVRGLRENLIRASRRLWGTVEGRLLLAENSYAAIFLDAGYYVVPELRGSVATENWTYGYGVGAQIETPLGLARVSFALSRDDSFDTGKVFIGLINQF